MTRSGQERDQTYYRQLGSDTTADLLGELRTCSSPYFLMSTRKTIHEQGERVAFVLGCDESFEIVATGEYADLVKAGVVDPTKVTRSALQNAASISGLLLTAEALVTELPEKEKAPPMPGGGMGGILLISRNNN